MPTNPALKLFKRRSLDQITKVPDDIISVYVIEQHIWLNEGTEEDRHTARKLRMAEKRTVEEFLIEPVRPFLNDFFRQLSAPFVKERRDNPVGQGYWIQAEFGSGKSHLLSFLGALALGGKDEWQIIQEKEAKAGKGKRESLYAFYENGLAKKSEESKGILVAVKTLVGQGGGGVGVTSLNKSLTEYVLDAVADQFFLENGRSLPLYPTEMLAERFLKEDFERYRRDLAKFLKDPAYFDEEKQWDLDLFLSNLQNNSNPGVQRDCGQRLWDFYERYLKTRPQIPMESEEVLKQMVERLLDEGYSGLLLILDEVSLFMQGRTQADRYEDEKALVVLSNRLAKYMNLPVWTICAAQQALEANTGGIRNIIADERLKLVPLLGKQDYYYDIALSRVREVTDLTAIDQYYEDYKRSFSWPQAQGKDPFTKFFPYYPPAIDVVRAVSYNLTTIRSALYFMLETIKTMRKRQSDELITLWSMFEDVINYEEDPSGTSRGVASIKTKYPDEWQAYEEAKRQIDNALSGPLKAYRSRCEKIVKTLFLYKIANLSPNGLTHEELMNAVMEWKDPECTADLQDNFDHYETLANKLATELVQVEKVGNRFRFNPTGTGTDPHEIFLKARTEAENNEALRRDAWRQLLALDGWYVNTALMSLDLVSNTQSIFRAIAPESQTDLTIRWHGREINGRVYMRNLLDIGRRNAQLPSINSADTGLDFHVYISSTPALQELDTLVKTKDDPRVIFWSPDKLTSVEENLLIDFAAYRRMVADAMGQDTEKARTILNWVQSRLREGMGSIYRMVPDSFGRGRITAADHSNLDFSPTGELASIFTPLVSQVLDSVYESRDLVFEVPAPFNDVNAINVINGVVKLSVFDRNARVSKELSASQNYGFALGIMRRPNDRKLDLSECRYAKDIAEWMKEKLGETGTGMSAATLYKNFMGIGGPNGLNYGLSKRLVQLYLLCMVREGQLRVTLTGRSQPVDAIDYSNIAGVDFKTSVLDGFETVQRLKPPEGWEVLAPFAAVLLKDDSLRTINDESDIHQAIQRLLEYKTLELVGFTKTHNNMSELINDIEADLPGATTTLQPMQTRLEAWEKFLKAQIDLVDPIPFFRSALSQSFGYPIFHENEVRQEDVDDLAGRRVETEQVKNFLALREDFRTALRYISGSLLEETLLGEITAVFARAASSLTARLEKWILSETALRSEFLDPVGEAMDTYRVRYLQLFDQVASHTEQIRQEIRDLPEGDIYKTIAALAQVKQLGADPRPQISSLCEAAQRSASLLPANLTRASVERDLKSGPHPNNCPLTFANASTLIQASDEALSQCSQLLIASLEDKARLLTSPALRERLEAGQGEAFIDELLSLAGMNQIYDTLVKHLGQADADTVKHNIALLQRYLSKMRIKRISLGDFHPGRSTIETGDVGQVVEEFRKFLANQFNPNSADESTIVEIE